MCWFPIVLGLVLMVIGGSIVLRYWTREPDERPSKATARLTMGMLVGALMTTIGLLVLILGIVGAAYFPFC
jgi:uncharacterized iron-regulated membrane protein